jgi:hypothetical protein
MVRRPHSLLITFSLSFAYSSNALLLLFGYPISTIQAFHREQILACKAR